MKKKVIKRRLARLGERLDNIENLLIVMKERQMTIATTLAPLVYDLRNGGWNIPSSAPYLSDGITEMVRKTQ